jgi:hypothetical protein
MNVVAIKEMSGGNETVGEMWQETKIFKSSEPIENILKWAMGEHDKYSRKQITITVPHDNLEAGE